MAFTGAEITNIANAALDFYVKGPAMKQSIQKRPLLDRLMKKQKTFPGGKGQISIPVKGVITSMLAGFTHDDTVSYATPANIKRATYAWKELHAGISLTHTELKIDGISVTDSSDSKSTSNHSQRELTVLTGLLEDKLDEMAESWAIDFDTMLHEDGIADPKKVPGIKALVTDAPATGTVGGIDRATNAWWRNRAATGAGKITASAANQTLTKFLRSEVRQLARYGSQPNFIPCGSAFLEALELEVAEKGIYTQQGFVKNGSTDIGLPSISMHGVGEFVYDPTMDTMGRSKFCYFLDDRHLRLWVMEGEDRKTHTPKRPADKYVMYRAMTWTGALCVDQFNGMGVYEVA